MKPQKIGGRWYDADSIREMEREIERLRAKLDAAGARACEWVNGDATPPDVGIYEYVTQN